MERLKSLELCLLADGQELVSLSGPVEGPFSCQGGVSLSGSGEELLPSSIKPGMLSAEPDSLALLFTKKIFLEMDGLDIGLAASLEAREHSASDSGTPGLSAG